MKTFPSPTDVIQLTWKAKALIRRIIHQVESYTSGNGEELAEVDAITSTYRTPSPPTSHKRRLYILHVYRLRRKSKGLNVTGNTNAQSNVLFITGHLSNCNFDQVFSAKASGILSAVATIAITCVTFW
jgi:hypothetical protein